MTQRAFHFPALLLRRLQVAAVETYDVRNFSLLRGGADHSGDPARAVHVQQVEIRALQITIERKGYRVAAAAVQPVLVLFRERPVRVIVGEAPDLDAAALFVLDRRHRRGAENLRIDIVASQPEYAVPEGVFGAAPFIEGEPS